MYVVTGGGVGEGSAILRNAPSSFRFLDFCSVYLKFSVVAAGFLISPLACLPAFALFCFIVCQPFYLFMIFTHRQYESR